MPQILTDTVIRSIKPPEKGTSTVWDGSLAGFGMRVSQGGTKSFIVLIGSGRRQSIGHYPIISLSTARTEAKRLLAEKTLGKVRPMHYAFEDALTEYLKASAEKNRPRTVSEYNRLIKSHFPYGRMSIASVQSRDAQRKLAAIDAPAERRAAFTAARAFFFWCVRQRIIDKSPLDHAEQPAVPKSRDRILTDDELVKVWKAAGECGQAGIITKLLLLTGCRRSEIGGLRKEWINLEQKTICLPSAVTKNSREHLFPIGAMCAAELSKNMPASGDTLLFPARGSKTNPFNGWSKSKAALDAKAKIDPWVLHTLRHTLAQGWQRLGIRMEVTERYLNHISGSFSGIAGVYQKYNYQDEMRAAAELWEVHIASLLQKAQDTVA